MRLFPLWILVFSISFCSAQHLDYSILTLDKSLTLDANAVVRLDEMKIQVLAHNQLKYSVDEVVTVLNKLGDRHSVSSISFDKERKIKNINVFVYNQLGQEINHFKKKDFADISAVDGFSLFNDDRILRHTYTPISYPYTIRTTYEVETSDTAFFPPWYFLSNYRVSVEKSHYEIAYSTLDLKPEIKEHNLEELIFNKIEAPGRFIYKAKNIPAVSYEELSPSFRDVVPRLSVRMKNFSLKGEYGEAENWKELGSWMNTALLKNRDELPQETIVKAKKLVEGVSDDLEKAKIIYKYVQDNTRYISVQIGIGGWKPISAVDVDLVKYGDCKGLSNYTYALLKAVGVTAYYTVIYAGKDKVDFQEDFAALQGNHAILAIPYKDNYYWIDCTSQVHPFGFVGDFTDDRKALIITPNGGEIVKTVSYINEQNLSKFIANFKLGERGEITADVSMESRGIAYDNRFQLENENRENTVISYKKYWDYINNLEVESSSFFNDREAVVFKESVFLSATNYATISGNRMFFIPNAFDRNNYVPDRYRVRIRPLLIDRGYLDESEFSIALPKGYMVEAMPEDVIIESEFGKYTMELIHNKTEHTIKYSRSLFIKKGDFEKEKYDDYRVFREKTAKNDNAQIVLIQN